MTLIVSLVLVVHGADRIYVTSQQTHVRPPPSMVAAAESVPVHPSLRRRPWRGGGRLAGRAGPRRAVGLAVELPRALLRAGELRAAVSSLLVGSGQASSAPPWLGEQRRRGRAGRAPAALPCCGRERARHLLSSAGAALPCCGRERSGGAERQWRRWRSRGGAAAAAVELPHGGRSARRRPCGRRRASSLVLVPPPSPGARRSPPSSLLSPPSSLLPPPSTAESGVGHARAGGGPRAAVEDMVWRREARPAAAVRRMQEPAAGRTGSAGRGPLVAGSTATIFFADVA